MRKLKPNERLTNTITKRNKNNRGITLILLAVTVIIMLILAGVTISAIKRTDMLKTSEKAVNDYAMAEEMDILSVAFANVFSRNVLNDEEITAESLRKELEKVGKQVNVEKNENELIVTFKDTGNVYKVNIETGKITLDGSVPPQVNNPDNPNEPGKTVYTITYQANGGTGNMQGHSGLAGDPITLKQNEFSKEGYFFKEWNTDALGNGTAYTNEQTVILQENLTLYAIWTRQTCTVNFVGVGGITFSKNSIEVPYGTTFTAVNDTISFSNISGEPIVATVPSSVDTSNIIYQWSPKEGSITNHTTINVSYQTISTSINYTINYYNGTQHLGTSRHTVGTAKALTSMATLGAQQASFSFCGWTTSLNSHQIVYRDMASVKNLATEEGGNVNLYAVWVRDVYCNAYAPKLKWTFYPGKSGVFGFELDMPGTWRIKYSVETDSSGVYPKDPIDYNTGSKQLSVDDKTLYIGCYSDSAVFYYKISNITPPNSTMKGETIAGSSVMSAQDNLNRENGNIRFGVSQFYNNRKYLTTIGEEKAKYIPEMHGWELAGFRSDPYADNAQIKLGDVSTSSATEFYAVYKRTLTINYDLTNTAPDGTGGSYDSDSTTNTQYFNVSGAITSPIFNLWRNFSLNWVVDTWALGSSSGTQYKSGTSYVFSPAVDETVLVRTFYPKVWKPIIWYEKDAGRYLIITTAYGCNISVKIGNSWQHVDMMEDSDGAHGAISLDNLTTSLELKCVVNGQEWYYTIDLLDSSGSVS